MSGAILHSPYDFMACIGTTLFFLVKLMQKLFFYCGELPTNQIMPSKKSTQLQTTTSEYNSEKTFMKCGISIVTMKDTQMHFSVSRYQ
jgi:hypothetical protein